MCNRSAKQKIARITGVFFLLIFFHGGQSRADIPAAFLDIGFGARPMGMGGAFTGLSDDANAIFWNPAGLARLQNSQLTFMHTRQFGLIPYTLLGYASRFRGYGVGLGVLTSGNDVLRETSVLF